MNLKKKLESMAEDIKTRKDMQNRKKYLIDGEKLKLFTLLKIVIFVKDVHVLE